MQTIRLTPEDVIPEQEHTLAHGTVPVVLSLSAYDIPKSVSADLQGGQLRITFNYVDNEESVARPADHDLTVLVGKNSGKVLGFVVKSDARKPREITVRIVQGVDEQLRRAALRPNQRLNYRLIRRVVESKLELLLTPS